MLYKLIPEKKRIYIERIINQVETTDKEVKIDLVRYSLGEIGVIKQRLGKLYRLNDQHNTISMEVNK
jgi:hypothetical protein